MSAVLTTLVSGCMLMRHVPGPYTPEIVGVIASEESLPGTSMGYTLADGRHITVDYATTTIVVSVGPAVGDLLLIGTRPDPWVALLAPGTLTTSRFPAGCFPLYSWGTDEGDSIQTDIGLRVPKAPGFDPGLLPETPDGPVPTAHPGPRYEGVGVAFCLNDEGFVTAHTW